MPRSELPCAQICERSPARVRLGHHRLSFQPRVDHAERTADGGRVLIPTIPDVLSAYGIPQILSRVSDFAADLNETIDPFGIVISKYREQATLHRTTVAKLRDDPALPPVFDTVIPEAVAIAEAATHQDLSTLRQKYSYGDRY